MRLLLRGAAVGIVVLGLAGAAPAYGEPAPTTAHPPAAAARPAAPDPNGPIGGTVPGVTGDAARSLAGAAGERFARMRGVDGDGGVTVQDRIHKTYGVFASRSALGAMATHGVRPALKVAVPDEVLYTPTLLPGRTACLEMTTIYFAGIVQLGAWDWCAADPGFKKLVVVNSTFLDTYTVTLNGRPAYTVKANQTDAATNTWTSYLYNHQTGAWDVFFTSSGTKVHNHDGWDMWEIYSNVNPNSGAAYYCADSRGFFWDSSDIQWSFAPGSWEPASTTNSTVNPANPKPADYNCASLSFTLDSPNNSYTVRNAPAPAGPVTSGIAGKCMDVSNSATADGTKVQSWTCNNSNAQRWTRPGDRTLRAFGKCLDVYYSGTTNGTKVQLWSCNGTDAQVWNYNATTGALTNPLSGKCLDVPNSSTTDGVQLQIWTCNGTNAQRWTIPG